jgi:hypothetical protein
MEMNENQVSSNRCSVVLFVEELVDLIDVVKDLVFCFFLRGKEFGRMVQLSQNFVIQIEILVPDIGQSRGCCI